LFVSPPQRACEPEPAHRRGRSMLPVPAPPNTPKTAAYVRKRAYLLKEVFRIFEFGASFTMAFAGTEGPKVSEADKAAFF